VQYRPTNTDFASYGTDLATGYCTGTIVQSPICFDLQAPNDTPQTLVRCKIKIICRAFAVFTVRFSSISATILGMAIGKHWRGKKL